MGIYPNPLSCGGDCWDSLWPRVTQSASVRAADWWDAVTEELSPGFRRPLVFEGVRRYTQRFRAAV